MTTIEWTHREGSKGETWNPLVGCSKVSAGCQNCYAIKDAHRLAGNPNPKINSVYSGLTERRGDRTEWTGKVNFVPGRLEQPLKTRKPTTWFVNSMSDLFHKSVTDEQLSQIFAVMALTPQHTYQVLTKRPERMLNVMQRLSGGDDGSVGVDLAPVPNPLILPNLWLGVTTENQRMADQRIPLLLQTPAAVRFLSCEPLLDKIDLTRIKSWHPAHGPEGANALQGGSWGHPAVRRMAGLDSPGYMNHSDSPTIDWVIVGGESGPKARPCHLPWIQSIVAQCADAKIPCFTKQMGSNPWQHDDQQILATGKGADPEEWARLDYNWPRQFPAGVEAVQL